MAKSAKAAEAVETEQVDISQAEAEKNEARGNTEAKSNANSVTYTVEEFAKAAVTVFERPIHQDIITGAFNMAGKKEATKAEAAKLVSEFLGKEVKLK